MAKVKIEKDTSERWLLTYADLMNLLLIFFIILYALSSADQQKFDQLAEAFRQEFGIIGATAPSSDRFAPGAGGDVVLPNPNVVIPAKLEQQQLEEVKEKVKELIDKQHLKGDVEVRSEERGVVISITAKLLFKSGSADIEFNSRPTIEEIGQMLKAIPGNQIRVEGHTDSDPIRNSIFASNWELSAARATTVLRLLVEKAGIDPSRISAVGYGEHRPKVKNDTEEHKAENRRVDIVIVKSEFDKSEAGSAEKKE